MTASSNKSAKVGRTREWLQSFSMALLATCLALPASAGFDIPTDPLTTGARVPPNILFILDDSGSMAFDAMPADSIGSDWKNRASVHNTVYYDPAKTYQPWVDASGELMAGGTSYNAAYGSFNLVGGTTIDLANSNSCQRFNRNHSPVGTDEFSSGGTEVCGGTQTFYVLKSPSAIGSVDLSDRSNFYRYQILPDLRIIRSEWLPRSESSPNYNNGPALSSGCSNTNNTRTWRRCTEITPEYAPGLYRSAAEERENFATWFSYHRTRMKAAKAGASAAFSELGGDVRVGFRTIWQRNGSTATENWPRQNVPIPVGYNDGRFEDKDGANLDNRTKWYARLHGSIGQNGTPLHGALHQAGKYFSGDGANGPYGPQTGTEQLACRQNFAILTTDGYWNSNSNYPSGERVGNADGTNGLLITEPKTGASYQYKHGPPYSDSHTGEYGTLADVAMHYWKTDLRPTMDNIVPTTDANPAFWQHMVTFGLSIGLSGSLGFESVEDVPPDFASWPDPIPEENATRIDDLLHAAVNSRGAFVAASDPDEFTRGLRAALAAIIERTGSFANISANSTALDTDTQLFQASYVSGVWTGDLVARAVLPSGAVGAVQWRASQGIPTSGRRVYTSEGLFPDSLTDEQEVALTRSGSGNYPVTGAQNAAYLAGNRSLEMGSGGHLRNRNHLLGAIVSSSPAYVKETNTLYVGANDGMLHAFNANSGAELFAFIPSGINWSHFGDLSRPDYAHRYFVDGPVVVSTGEQSGDDRNILVATLGKGGKGLFALDVTTPGSFNHSDVKWEKYETDEGNMGLVLGAPVIANVRTGVGENSPVVIVANGINSSNHRAVLLVYDLSSGDLIKEIDTGAGSEDAPNGLTGAVGWDSNGDGVVDTVYGGDMLGNVWKFDLSGSPMSWGVDGDPMFVARDSDGKRQPISARLTVSMHPANFQTWVFFGTGRFMTIDDVSDRSVQSLYGIRDDGGDVIVRSDLEARSTVIVGTRTGADGQVFPVRSFEAHQALPSAKRGWYIDLLEPPKQDKLGERIISEVQVVNRVLVVASIIPMNDACQSDGRGYLNALDAFTGTSLAGGSFFDIDGDDDFSDEVIGDDGLPVGSIDLGIGMPTLPNLLRKLAATGGSTGETETVSTMDARFTGRVSWREEVEE